MVTATTTLGGTAASTVVGRISHGLMMMTAIPTPIPDEQCFEAIKSGIDALPPGAKMLLNSGDFYSLTWGTQNLELLSRFFEKYPDYADKTFLSVKGGLNLTATPPGPDSSMEYLRLSVERSQKALGSIKKIDLFEPARVDRRIPIEQQMESLVALLKEGKFTHIGLSECSASTLRRANAVYPVSAVEIEISPWSYEEKQKEVVAVAKELGIAVIAYSPLGRGFLTGQIKSKSDLPAGDLRTRFTRFNDEVIQHNMALVDALTSISKKVGCTPAQLSLKWVTTLGPNIIPIPGSSKASRTLENLEAGDIELTDEILAEINGVINEFEVKGDRYYGAGDEATNLWG